MQIIVTKRSILRAISFFAIIVLSTQVLALNSVAENTELENIESAEFESNDVSYTQYIASYNGAERPKKEIAVTNDSLSDKSTGTTFKSDVEGLDGSAVLTEEESFATWNFKVEEAGLYDLVIRYFPYGGKGGDINRILYIDGKIPFAEAKYLTISRIWKEEYSGEKTDKSGNDVLPNEVEVKCWKDYTVVDSTGYIASPLSIYLTEGEHTLSLESEREPLMIEKLLFTQAKEVKKYSDVLNEYKSRGYESADGEIQFVQAEEMKEKTSRSIYPLNDRDSESTQPQDVFKTKLNYTGGNNWKSAG